MDIIPSNISLSTANIEFLDKPNREEILKILINKVKDNYDFIFIDCSPNLDLLTINALTAADSVIIPVQCEFFALESLGKLLNTIKLVQNRLNPELDIEGFLLTMYEPRLDLSNQVANDVRKHFHDMVFKSVIQRNNKICEAPSLGKPVIVSDAASKGAVSYLNLAKEVIKNNLLVF